MTSLDGCRESDRGFGVRLLNEDDLGALESGLMWMIDALPPVLLARLLLTARPGLQRRAREFVLALTGLLQRPAPIRSLSSANAADRTSGSLRTVERRLRAERWPSPDRLRMWIALFYVTYVAQLSGRSPTHCARLLGSDANTVYRFKRRLLGSATAFDAAAPDALDRLARMLFAQERMTLDLTVVDRLRRHASASG